MNEFFNEDHFSKQKEEAMDAKVTQETFYKEHIKEEAPKKKKGLFTVAVLFFGTILGIGIGSAPLIQEGVITPVVESFSSKKEIPASNITEPQTIKIQSTESPIVPIAAKVSPSIVAISIKTEVQDWFGEVYSSQGTGSGIILDKQGHIVTNNHVVNGANEIMVILSDGKEIPAKVIGRDVQSDLAVIKVENTNLPVADLGDSTQLKVGELAVAIGSPLGTDYAGSVTSGIISGLNRKISVEDRTLTLIQTDAAINPGNSGGALVNSEGQVIGINTLKAAESAVEGMGFAIPINEAKPIIEQLIKEGKVVRPILGIGGETISEEISKQYDVPTGVLVRQVLPFSGADIAGIQRGDIITKIEGNKIKSIEELVQIVQGKKVGDTIKVEVYNRETEKTDTLSVKLRENKENN